MRRTRLFVLVVSALCLTSVALAATLGDAAAAPKPSAKVAFSAIANPTRNAAPAPDYYTPCWAGGAKGAANTTACHAQELAAINHQHALEHIRAITLPRNFWTLPAAWQIFVITNLERVSRGLKPVLGINAQMSTWANTAAIGNSDVPLLAWDLSNGTQLQTFGSVWAGDLNVLDANFIWMYADGWSAVGSSNADCTSAKSSGCWGHRQIILGRYGNSAALVAGVGTVLHHLANGALNSDAQAFANYTGPKPKLVYTWAAAVAAGAR